MNLFLMVAFFILTNKEATKNVADIFALYHPATKPLSDGLVKLPVLDEEIVGF